MATTSPSTLFTAPPYNVATAALCARVLQAAYATDGVSMSALVSSLGGDSLNVHPFAGGMQTRWVSFSMAGGVRIVAFTGLLSLRQVLTAHLISRQANYVSTFPGMVGLQSVLATDSYMAMNNAVLSDIISFLSTGDTAKVIFTGHSFGGLYAQLAALYCATHPVVSGRNIEVKNVYAFGSPKLFDEDGRKIGYSALVPNTISMQLDGDPIPETPARNILSLTTQTVAGGALNAVLANERQYSSTIREYRLHDDGTAGRTSRFGALTDTGLLGLVSRLLATGELPPKHRIEEYYFALERGWQRRNEGQSASQVSRQTQNAVGSLPVPDQPAAADVSSGSLPAANTFAPQPTPPAGGANAIGRQVITVRGLPRRSDSAVTAPRRNWRAGDGRVKRQLIKTHQLLNSILLHDDKVEFGIRRGTQVITNDALWSDQNAQAFYNTMDLIAEAISSYSR